MLGGVGRNLAAALELLGERPIFITALANDNLGEFARSELLASCRPAHQADNQLVSHFGATTGEERLKILEWRPRDKMASSCFALVLIDSLTGQCEFVIANLDAKQAISSHNLAAKDIALERTLFERESTRPPLVVMDANLPSDSIDFLLKLSHRWRVPVFLEPTDARCLPALVALIRQLRNESSPSSGSNRLEALSYLSPNLIELETMLDLLSGRHVGADESVEVGQRVRTLDDVEVMAREIMERHLPELRCLLVTMDKRGLMLGLRAPHDEQNIDLVRLGTGATKPLGSTTLIFKHYPAAEIIERPISGSGAGDCFAAGFISGLINNLQLRECVQLGFKAASCALRSTSTVPQSLRDLPEAR